jgi:glycosyltransferase involved in cell wall biosynthesis
MNEVRKPRQLSPEASVAAAQARRDRERLAAAQAEILDLRARLAVAAPVGVKAALNRSLRARVGRLESTPLRPVLAAARRLAQARRPTAPAGAMREIAASTPAAATRGRALIIDDHWPQPDRDSGSVDICNLAEALMALGFDVVLAAARDLHGEQPARDALSARGITCLMPADATTMDDFIVSQGNIFDLCVLCRVFCGGQYLEAVLAHCIKARIVFNSIDLNFLREERKARLLGDSGLLKIAQDIRPREEFVIRHSDVTIVVSETERALLAATLPDCLAVTLPLARPLMAGRADFKARHGIGFIGGFAHAPNVDAVRYFLKDIWPLIRASLPDCELSIVGADAPANLLEGEPAGVTLRGHVPDVGPWFESLRLTVAPLRFGAGAKGKVASSLAAGVPCVATDIAAEGMALSPDQGVLTASDAAGFAAAVIQLHGDAALWKRLAVGAISHASDALSTTKWRDELDLMLTRIGI